MVKDILKKNNKALSSLIIFSYILLLVILIPISIFINNHYLDIWYKMFYIISAISLINGITSYLLNERKHNFIIFTFIISLALMLISTMLSSNFNLSFFGGTYRHVGFLSYLFFLGILLNAINIEQKDIKKIAILFLIVSVIMCIISLFDNELTDKLYFSIYYTKYEFTHPYHGAFYNANHFGYYLSIVIFVPIYLYFQTKTNLLKFIYLLSYNILLYTLILNNTFGSYLGVFISIVFLTIYFIIKRQKEFLIFLALFAVNSSFTKFNDSYIVRDNFVALFTDVSETIDGTQVNAGTDRINIWRNTTKYIKESPLFGYGAENLDYKFYEDRARADTPHNIILELAAYFGIPVAILYLVALIYTFILFIKRITNITPTLLFLTASCLSYFISSLFGNVFFYTTPYYIISFGIMLKCLKEGENNDEKNIKQRI